MVKTRTEHVPIVASDAADKVVRDEDALRPDEVADDIPAARDADGGDRRGGDEQPEIDEVVVEHGALGIAIEVGQHGIADAEPRAVGAGQPARGNDDGTDDDDRDERQKADEQEQVDEHEPAEPAL